MARKKNKHKQYTLKEVDSLLNQRFSKYIHQTVDGLNESVNTEIEFRLGRLVYRKNRRIFDTFLSKKDFTQIHNLLNSKENYWDEVKELTFDDYQKKSNRIRKVNGKVIEAIQKSSIKKVTLNLRKPYFDIRLGISKETPLNKEKLNSLKVNELNDFRLIKKHRYIYRKEFVEISLTEYKSGKRWKRQVEIEANPLLIKNIPSKYVCFALYEYLKLFIKRPSL